MDILICHGPNDNNILDLNIEYNRKNVAHRNMYIITCDPNLHLLTFQTPIFMALKKIKSIKSIVGISPTMVLLFHLPFVYLKM